METNNSINPLNLFREGKIATGDSFIGREKLLSALIQRWTESGGNGSFSVTGLNRMGKTSLVHEFCERVKQIEPDVICVIVSLQKNTWPNLIQLIMKLILREAKHLDDWMKKCCNDTCSISLEPKNVLNENEVMWNYIDMLEHMEKIGQKYLLAVDEFDGAKMHWANHASYFEGLRDSVQHPGFNLMISRRPLEIIEMDSYGNSCFHNVFTELYVCAFHAEQDMPEYYDFLSSNYGVQLNDDEREKIEEYTGFCPAFLTALGSRLASDAINKRNQSGVEEIFTEPSFQTNYQLHYKEFLKRMQEDGLWNDLVRIIMDISLVRINHNADDTFHKAKINQLCCKGYLRQKINQEYVVFSDDFSLWAKHMLYHSEIETIYDRIIMSEVAIKNMLKEKMPQIWGIKYPGSDWQDDFLTNHSHVPQCVRFFTRPHPQKPPKPPKGSDLQTYLSTAKRFNPSADVTDALTINVKLLLVKEFWEDGIKDCFLSEPYSKWSDCFDIIRKIRNPLFHATITPKASTPQQYYLLQEANENANRIISQLS